ncbi:hypothetical protein HID58_071073, partial [Brassica napus]
MVSNDSFSRRLGGLYCLYCLHEIQPFKLKFFLGCYCLGKRQRYRDSYCCRGNKYLRKTCLQNTLVLCAYRKYVTLFLKTFQLTSETEITIHSFRYDDLSFIHKQSIGYAEAKKRARKIFTINAIPSHTSLVDVKSHKSHSEEKELIGEKVDKLKEECDSQKLSFYEKTEFGLDTTQKLLKDVENEDDDDDDDEDDGFGELDH